MNILEVDLTGLRSGEDIQEEGEESTHELDTAPKKESTLKKEKSKKQLYMEKAVIFEG